MKNLYLALSGASLLLAACNTAPDTNETAANVPPAMEAAGPVRPSPSDSAAAPPDNAAVAPSATEVKVESSAAGPTSSVAANTLLTLSFAFRPAADPEQPNVPKTSVHILLKGPKNQDIDMGRVPGRPDVVDEAKARQAGFPADMLLGFRSYSAAAGTSSDLAVVRVGDRLRVLQRRVAEDAAEAPEFMTSREITLPPNTRVVAAAVPAAGPKAKAGAKKKTGARK